MAEETEGAGAQASGGVSADPAALGLAVGGASREKADAFLDDQRTLTANQNSITGVEKIYALVGGFHLMAASPEYLATVMAELKEFDLDHVMPMHCSGQNFIDLAKREIPEKLVLCGTGSSYTFSA